MQGPLFLLEQDHVLVAHVSTRDGRLARLLAC